MQLLVDDSILGQEPLMVTTGNENIEEKNVAVSPPCTKDIDYHGYKRNREYRCGS